MWRKKNIHVYVHPRKSQVSQKIGIRRFHRANATMLIQQRSSWGSSKSYTLPNRCVGSISLSYTFFFLRWIVTLLLFFLPLFPFALSYLTLNYSYLYLSNELFELKAFSFDDYSLTKHISNLVSSPQIFLFLLPFSANKLLRNIFYEYK